MSLGGWFLPRTLEDGFYPEKKCFVSICTTQWTPINTGTITPGKSPIKPRWRKLTFNIYICRKQVPKLFPSFEDCIEDQVCSSSTITLLWYTPRKMHQLRPDISGKGLALERQFALDLSNNDVKCENVHVTLNMIGSTFYTANQISCNISNPHLTSSWERSIGFKDGDQVIVPT